MSKLETMQLDWHSAFYEAIQAELLEYLPHLRFQQEYHLNDQPLRIDAIIIKAEAGIEIKKNFAENFRGHNIIEFKSPDDSLTVSGYIKAIGYACIYQAIERVNYNDITLTLVCTKHPRKLLKDLNENKLFRVEEKYPGIYVVEGERFPVRIIESKRLTAEDNLWLKCLRKEADWPDLEKVLQLSAKAQEQVNLGAYLYALLSANREYALEGSKMSKKEMKEIQEMWETLMVRTGYKERVMAEGEAKGEARGEARGAALGKSLGVSSALTIVKGLQKNIPLTQLAEESGMSLGEVEKIRSELLPVM